MVKTRETLEKIEGSGRLQRAVLEVDPQAIQPPTENAPPIPASAKRPSRRVVIHRGFREKLKRNTRRQPPKPPPERDGSTNRATDGAGDNTYEADNESDCELPALQPPVTTVPAQDAGGPSSNTVEYGLILRDGKYFQVPLDSEEYGAAAGPSGNVGPDLDHPPAAIRVDEVVESMSDEERDHAQYQPLEELMSGFVTSAPITPDASDAETETETETDEPPAVEIDIRLPTYVLVAEGMNLASCRDGETANPSVCVDWASIERVFCIAEPCSAVRKHKCKHITLELEDGLGFAELPPGKIQLGNLRVLDAAAEDVSSSGQSPSPSSVLLLNRQCLRDPCYHSRFFDFQHNRTRCALPIKLFARAVSFELSVSPEPPAEVESEDHKYACRLLRSVMLDKTAQIPSEIELHTLIRILVLAHKDARHIPQKFLEQARRWVLLSRPPSSFDDDDDDDDDALLWIWLMWKLQMVEGFKTLSSVVQRQARNPISRRWQDGPGIRFGIELPDTVLSMLNPSFGLRTLG